MSRYSRVTNRRAAERDVEAGHLPPAALPTAEYFVSRNALQALQRAAKRYGASEAELAAIMRLEEERALLVDIERLEPLAVQAGLPWAEMFPELKR